MLETSREKVAKWCEDEKSRDDSGFPTKLLNLWAET